MPLEGWSQNQDWLCHPMACVHYWAKNIRQRKSLAQKYFRHQKSVTFTLCPTKASASTSLEKEGMDVEGGVSGWQGEGGVNGHFKEYKCELVWCVLWWSTSFNPNKMTSLQCTGDLYVRTCIKRRQAVSDRWLDQAVSALQRVDRNQILLVYQWRWLWQKWWQCVWLWYSQWW